MWCKFILSSVIISLVLLGVLNSAFATDGFDRDVIATNHFSTLTITDPSQTGIGSITATVTPSVGPPIQVELVEQNGSSGIFKSDSIKFKTSGQSQSSPLPPELVVSENSQVTVTYPGFSIPSVLIADNDDDNTLDSPPYNSTRSVTQVAARGCSATYGGDSDKDGICNNWETSSGLVINYPTGTTYTLSCDPNKNYNNNLLGDQVCPSTTKKDIYVEIDYMQGHKPDLDAIKAVVAAFNNAPAVPNAQGFQLHVIIDEQILPHIDLIKFPGSTATSDFGFLHIKDKEFGTDNERLGLTPTQWDAKYKAKSQVFYYYIWAHDLYWGTGASGISELSGNDGMVTLGQFDGSVGNTDEQAGTSMHELGHNLGLNHGGDKFDEVNCKPNSLSVMSYSRQFNDLVTDRKLDYSRTGVGIFNTQPVLQTATLGLESNLIDTNGIGSYVTPENIVYGIGSGQITITPIPQSIINWPANKTFVRNISDSQGNVVCRSSDPPPYPQELDSFNEWGLILNTTGKSSHWSSGRSVGSASYSDSSVNQSEIIRIVAPSITDVQISDKESNEYPDFYIPEKQWCLTKEQAEIQIMENPELYMEYAPLCGPVEITIDNVRAIRSINVDNLIRKINDIDITDFTPPSSRDDLINDLNDIRTLVLNDKIVEAIHSHKSLKISIDENIKDNPAKDTVLQTLDGNIIALSDVDLLIAPSPPTFIRLQR